MMLSNVERYLPSELWMMILSFMRPHSRLRFIGMINGHDTKKFLLNLNIACITKAQILSLYENAEISYNNDVNEKIWEWFIHSDTDDFLWIDNVDVRIYRNVEKHFTEEWCIYRGDLHATKEHLLSLDFPMLEGHFIDDVLGISFGRMDRLIEYGYGDYDYY